MCSLQILHDEHFLDLPFQRVLSHQNPRQIFSVSCWGDLKAKLQAKLCDQKILLWMSIFWAFSDLWLFLFFWQHFFNTVLHPPGGHYAHESSPGAVLTPGGWCWRGAAGEELQSATWGATSDIGVSALGYLTYFDRICPYSHWIVSPFEQPWYFGYFGFLKLNCVHTSR